MRSLPNTSTHDQQWESNPRPFDIESNALSTMPHAPKSRLKMAYLMVQLYNSDYERPSLAIKIVFLCVPSYCDPPMLQ